MPEDMRVDVFQSRVGVVCPSFLSCSGANVINHPHYLEGGIKSNWRIYFILFPKKLPQIFAAHIFILPLKFFFLILLIFFLNTPMCSLVECRK